MLIRLRTHLQKAQGSGVQTGCLLGDIEENKPTSFHSHILFDCRLYHPVLRYFLKLSYQPYTVCILIHPVGHTVGYGFYSALEKVMLVWVALYAEHCISPCGFLLSCPVSSHFPKDAFRWNDCSRLGSAIEGTLGKLNIFSQQCSQRKKSGMP